MRSDYKTYLLVIGILLLTGFGYLMSCTQKDTYIAPTSETKVERGNLKLDYKTDPKVTFDKAHSNVGWETAYLGSLSLLTGRFDTLRFNYFNFDEANPENTRFEAYVWLNSVNTSEPGRDKGCLAGNGTTSTFGTTTTMTTEPENIAMITSKTVAFSKSDNGYTVRFSLSFHGHTDTTLIGNLYYVGKVESATRVTHGFSFNFKFLAKTDFGISSVNIADLISVKCNAIFRRSL